MFMHIFHNKWMINGQSGHLPRNSVEIIQQIDLNYADTAELKNVLGKNKISLILIHFNRIGKNYTKKFDTFIKNLEPLSKVVFRDHNYLLLSVRE